MNNHYIDYKDTASRDCQFNQDISNYIFNQGESSSFDPQPSRYTPIFSKYEGISTSIPSTPSSTMFMKMKHAQQLQTLKDSPIYNPVIESRMQCQQQIDNKICKLSHSDPKWYSSSVQSQLTSDLNNRYAQILSK